MREQLARRPLVVAFAAFALGLSSGHVLWHLCGALLLLVCLPDRRCRVTVLCAVLVGYLVRPVPPAHMVWERHQKVVTGRVASVPTDLSENQVMSMLDTAEGRYMLVVPPGQDVSIGDVVRVGGEVSPTGEGSNSRGAIGRLQAIGGIEVVTAGPFLGRWGLAVRDSFRSFVDSTLVPKDAALVDAVAFNVTAEIDDVDYSNMKKAGIIHVVSTSGVHVILVAGFLAWLARKTPVPRPLSLAVLALLLVVYACAAGLRPPMVRSVLMALLALSAYLFRREPDGPSSLAFAGGVSLMFDPWSVVDIGFWLSMVAVGALVLFIDPFESTGQDRSPRAWFASTWKTSLAATLATVPLVGLVFGQLPLAGPVANLVAVPASELLLGMSLVSWLVNLVVPVLGHGLLLLSAGPLLAFLRGAAAAGAWASVAAPALSVYWCAWFYGLAMAFWRPSVRPA